MVAGSIEKKAPKVLKVATTSLRTIKNQMSISLISSKAQLDTVLSENSRVCLFFWAAWHEPSRPGGQMDMVASALAQMHSNVSFYKVIINADISHQLFG